MSYLSENRSVAEQNSLILYRFPSPPYCVLQLFHVEQLQDKPLVYMYLHFKR